MANASMSRFVVASGAMLIALMGCGQTGDSPSPQSATSEAAPLVVVEQESKTPEPEPSATTIVDKVEPPNIGSESPPISARTGPDPRSEELAAEGMDRYDSGHVIQAWDALSEAKALAEKAADDELVTIVDEYLTALEQRHGSRSEYLDLMASWERDMRRSAPFEMVEEAKSLAAQGKMEEARDFLDAAQKYGAEKLNAENYFAARLAIERGATEPKAEIAEEPEPDRQQPKTELEVPRPQNPASRESAAASNLHLAERLASHGLDAGARSFLWRAVSVYPETKAAKVARQKLGLPPLREGRSIPAGNSRDGQSSTAR